MEGYRPSSYGDAFADVYDEWYADVSDVEATVAAVAALAGDGPVLELGVGTGRLAIPLASAGLEVHGIDASPAMLERLAAKPGGGAVQARLGDFADVAVEVEGGFSLALVAFNTFFNLSTEVAQRRCFTAVAERLAPSGLFLLEAFVPADTATTPDASVTPSVVEADRVVLQVTRRDVAAQQVAGSIVTITEAGIRLRPWLIRYAAPAELDAMASAAGLELVSRHAGWQHEPFSQDSDRHVTMYRKARR